MHIRKPSICHLIRPSILHSVSAQALIAESIKKRASLHGSSAPAPAPAADSEGLPATPPSTERRQETHFLSIILPTELLSDWEEATDPEGKPYYWNTKTMETVWDKPLKNPPPKPTPLSERPDKVWEIATCARVSVFVFVSSKGHAPPSHP